MRQTTGGFSPDKNTADLIFLPKRNGKHAVTVKIAADGKKSQTKGTMDWKLNPFMAILDIQVIRK
jgi:hypothetical protein